MLSQVEAGLKGMSLAQYEKVANVLDVNIAVLLADVDLSREDLAMIDRLTALCKKKGTHYEAIKTLLGV